jgi:hypothetical protein
MVLDFIEEFSGERSQSRSPPDLTKTPPRRVNHLSASRWFVYWKLVPATSATALGHRTTPSCDPRVVRRAALSFVMAEYIAEVKVAIIAPREVRL